MATTQISLPVMGCAPRAPAQCRAQALDERVRDVEASTGTRYDDAVRT